MVRLNQKVFTTYIILACFFIVVDLLTLISAESNKVKEFILADAIVLLPIVVLGMIYCKKDITEFEFNLFFGIDSFLFCILFLFIMYHQTSMYNIEKYMNIIVILMVMFFIVGGILGYLRIGNNLYMEVGGGVVLGVSALGHLYAKYCVKNIKFTLIICLCAITYLMIFCIGYHFGSNYSV
ncbi:hypothetical protein [Butyrivibrio sp. M55]|uniref:hypothetical protein n=1 Tax=Butyrivibrio sp. M55 TaxID=1855323 RepID=UPI0008E49234|nr:hypothetical protein [Butyrivibrio sp. M55]SFU67482.1 hypothetical protein SAMN05216540_105249 [Butyrivibrio sp. M55]